MVKEIAEVVYQAEIATDIMSLLLKVTFARNAVPGQFVSLYSADGSRLLPRPISICETDAETGTIRLVYRIAGKGTREFSELRGGDRIEILGPLGNGFPIDVYREKRVLLVGGGIGIPPLLFCADRLKDAVFAVGYRSETYLLEDLKRRGEVHVATEDGSLGTCGNVIDALGVGRAAAGPVLDFHQFDAQLLADLGHGSVGFGSRSLQDTAGEKCVFHVILPPFPRPLQRLGWS